MKLDFSVTQLEQVINHFYKMKVKFHQNGNSYVTSVCIVFTSIKRDPPCLNKGN